MTDAVEDSRGLATEADLLDPGSLLCHYTRAETAFAHILPSGKLRMNPYLAMRDPFENRYPHFWVPKGVHAEDGHALYVRVTNELGHRRGGFRLLSFTRGDMRPGEADDLPFRCPWGRPRMWEQYADNHSGVCLVFERERLLAAIRQELGGDCWEGDVDYTLRGFSSSKGAELDLDWFRELGVRQAADQHVVQHYRDLFFLKTEDWAAEYEYRVVDKTEPGFDQWPPPTREVSYGDSLRYVLLNVERFPHWQLPGAVRAISDAGAKYRTIDWNAGRPYPGIHVGWSK